MAKDKDQVINLKEKVTVYATKSAKYHKEGQEISCHPLLAEHMVMKGVAVEKAKKASKEA